jgi:peptide/nickel transport system permease protein
MRLFISKLLYVVLMLFIISIISFLAIHFAPNSFFASGELNPNITKESIEHLKSIYGLDKPLYIQYISWITALLHLDFGISFASGKAVKDEILSRIHITLIINVISMILVFVISLYLGIKAAFKQDSFLDRTLKQFSLISYAIPSFYLALLLIIVFAVGLEWFPISGLESIEPKEGIWKTLDQAWHLFLPIFVIVFGGVGSLMMYVRSLTVDILKSDYIFFAKARGLSDKVIFRRYILPNLSPPIVTMLGLSLPGLIGGSVILEQIFGIDGMGLLFYQSAMSRDYPVIMGILIISAFLTLLGNIIADLILLKLNPHFKRAQA